MRIQKRECICSSGQVSWRGWGWAHTLEQASVDRVITTAFIVWCVSFMPGGMHSTHRLPGSPRQFSEAEAIVGLALLKAERTNLKS